MKVGVILALHKNREKGDFVVSKRVTNTEYPPVNVEEWVKNCMATGAYTHVWFQEVTVPE